MASAKWRNDPLVQALGTHIARPPSQPKSGSQSFVNRRPSGGNAVRASTARTASHGDEPLSRRPSGGGAVRGSSSWTARTASRGDELDIEEPFLWRRSMGPLVTKKGQSPVSALAPEVERSGGASWSVRSEVERPTLLLRRSASTAHPVDAQRRPHIRSGGLTDRPSSWDYSSSLSPEQAERRPHIRSGGQTFLSRGHSSSLSAVSSPEQAERHPLPPSSLTSDDTREAHSFLESRSRRRELGAAGGQTGRSSIERARDRDTIPASPEQHDQLLRAASSPPAHRPDPRMYTFPSPPDALNSRGARSLPLGAGKVRHLLPSGGPPRTGEPTLFSVSPSWWHVLQHESSSVLLPLIVLRFESAVHFDSFLLGRQEESHADGNSSFRSTQSYEANSLAAATPNAPHQDANMSSDVPPWAGGGYIPFSVS